MDAQDDETARLSEAERIRHKKILDTLQEDINTLSKWDPDSLAFRYPSHEPDLKISFGNVRTLMKRISYQLQGLDVGVWEYLQAKLDWLRT